MNNQRKFILIVASIGVAGTFMPWVKLPFGSLDGTKGDGWITLALFTIPLLISLLGEKNYPVTGIKLILGSLFGFLAGLLALWKIFDLKYNIPVDDENPFSEALNSAMSIGFGLYLIVLCGILLMLTSFIFSEQKKISS